MGSDAMKVAIPRSFICPISLEVMQDPVTILTGHTYDRKNIERWFESGHKICPLTMQIVQDRTLIPNHMLRKIIINWFSNRVSSWRSPSSLLYLAPEDLPAQLRIGVLLGDLRKEGGRVSIEAILKLRSLANENVNNKKVMVDEGVVRLLLPLLVTDAERRRERFFALIGALSVLPLSQNEKEEIGRTKALSLICLHLFSGNVKRSSYSLEMLSSLAEVDELKLYISRTPGIIRGLLRLIEEKSSRSRPTMAVGLLLALSSVPKNIATLIEEGAIRVLADALARVEMRERAEDVIALMKALCSVPEGRAAMLNHAAAIPAVVRSMTKVSEPCTRMATEVLLSVCRDEPEGGRWNAVEAGAMLQLLFVMQGQCSSLVKKRAMELLKLLRRFCDEFRCGSPKEEVDSIILL